MAAPPATTASSPSTATSTPTTTSGSGWASASRPGRQPGADYVLKRPGAAERAVLAQAVEEAADAVEAIVTEGVDVAMSRFNGAG